MLINEYGKTINKKYPVSNRKTRNLILSSVLIAAITIISFLPSLNNGLTNWDDNEYVENNPDIAGLSFQNIVKVFSSNYVGNYQPLTMLTYMVEYHFFQLNPLPYHAMNLLLHIINSLLVLALIYGLSGSVLTGALVSITFAIHPLRVESVAWISERKDVLSALFYFLSLLSYLHYLTKGNKKFYYLCGLSLLFSLLSKPMGVSLPFVLVLIYYLKNGKLNKKALIDTVPFFVIAAVFVVVALIAQKNSGAIAEYPFLSIMQRICTPFYGIVFYQIKSIVPFHLCAFYPFPEKLDSGFNFYLMASPFIVVGIATAVYYLRTYSRTIAFGTLFFLITALPILQIIPIGNAIVAERYTYIPMLGIYFIFAEGSEFLLKHQLKKNVLGRMALLGGIGAMVLVFCVLTFQRCYVWKNSLTLWNDVIVKKPSAIAFNNRGGAYSKEGDLDNAIKDCDTAIALDPKFGKAYKYRADAENRKGDYSSAILDYNQAVLLTPNDPMAYFNRGTVFSIQNLVKPAIEDFSKAIKLNPKYTKAYINRAISYYTINDYDNGIQDLNKAINLDDKNSKAWFNRGVGFNAKGEQTLAFRDFNKACSLGCAPACDLLNR